MVNGQTMVLNMLGRVVGKHFDPQVLKHDVLFKRVMMNYSKLLVDVHWGLPSHVSLVILVRVCLLQRSGWALRGLNHFI